MLHNLVLIILELLPDIYMHWDVFKSEKRTNDIVH